MTLSYHWMFDFVNRNSGLHFPFEHIEMKTTHSYLYMLLVLPLRLLMCSLIDAKVLYVFRACAHLIIIKKNYLPYDHHQSQWLEIHNEPFHNTFTKRNIIRMNHHALKVNQLKRENKGKANPFETREAKKISDSSCECSSYVRINECIPLLFQLQPLQCYYRMFNTKLGSYCRCCYCARNHCM